MTSPEIEIGDRIRVVREEGPDFVQVTEGVVSSISSSAYFANTGGLLGYFTDDVTLLQKNALYDGKFVCGSWDSAKGTFARFWDDPVLDSWSQLFEEWLHAPEFTSGGSSWAAFYFNGVLYVDDRNQGRFVRAA